MRPLFIRRTAMLLLMIMLLVLSGCATLRYYGQSIGGQWEVWNKSQPIQDVLATPETPEELRHKLRTVMAARDFASNEMALPKNDSYRSYADLQRPFVVWNVFATKPFEMSLKRWCFPFAGCVGYRGYFSQADAEAFAHGLGDEGLDVYVGGTAAYSTLGWFDDPVLNTVINRSPVRIAGLIFHELAHQQLYVEGDTAFNEGFATTVQLEGERRWLAKYGDESQRRDYEEFQQRQIDFVSLVANTRDQLQAVYAQTMGNADMQKRKSAIQRAMRLHYQQLKDKWGGYSGYDAWFAQDLNNAQLAAVTTYRDYVPAFQQILAEHKGDMAAFYRACEAMSDMPPALRVTRLTGGRTTL